MVQQQLPIMSSVHRLLLPCYLLYLLLLLLVF